MASLVHDNARKLFAQADIDWLADTIKVLLVETGHTPSAADEYVADIVADEVDDASYARKTLAGKTVTIASNKANLNADNPVWESLIDAQDVAGAYVFKQITNDADSPLICYIEATLDTDGRDATLKLGGGATSGPAMRI